MITYTEVRGGGSLQLKVRLEKKIIGGIYKAPDGGFYYRPAGSKLLNETFETLAEVKLSLEED